MFPPPRPRFKGPRFETLRSAKKNSPQSTCSLSTRGLNYPPRSLLLPANFLSQGCPCCAPVHFRSRAQSLETWRASGTLCGQSDGCRLRDGRRCGQAAESWDGPYLVLEVLSRLVQLAGLCQVALEVAVLTLHGSRRGLLPPAETQARKVKTTSLYHSGALTFAGKYYH